MSALLETHWTLEEVLVEIDTHYVRCVTAFRALDVLVIAVFNVFLKIDRKK